jgi:hypothetical protein
MPSYNIIIKEVEGQEKILELGQHFEQSKDIMNGIGYLGDTSSSGIPGVMK